MSALYSPEKAIIDRVKITFELDVNLSLCLNIISRRHMRK
jgi:hypothetical protein